MDKNTEKRKTTLKWVIAAEIIVCYMAVLTAVSYARGPERYKTAHEPLLVTEDFVSFAGQPAEPGGAFLLENEAQGTAVGYQAELDLAALENVQISFQAECPAGYAGGILHVDLYNGEAGYDSPEQEFSMTVQAGHNEAAFTLAPGAEHPDTAQLRIFTLDRAGYSLEGVQIHEQRPLPKVSGGIWAGVGACFLLLAGTVICRIIKGKR